MQLVTVKFERVFDIVQTGGRSQDTWFSFSNEEMTQFGAKVNGHPNIADGMTVTVLLGSDGNWQSILGWVDQNTGEIFFEGWSYSALMAVFAICFSGFVVAYILESDWHQYICYLLSVAGGALLFGTINLINTWHQWRKLRSASTQINLNRTER